MAWTILAYPEFGHGGCCGVGFDGIFIKRHEEEAQDIFIKEFGGNKKYTAYVVYTGKTFREAWKSCSILNECYAEEIIISELFELNRFKVYKDYRTVMPNGVDGMNCHVCKSWCPYVNPNEEFYMYACRECRSRKDTQPTSLIVGKGLTIPDESDRSIIVNSNIIGGVLITP